MTSFLSNRVAVIGLAIGLLLAGALTAARGEEDKKTPTTHYIDREKHVELDVPLTWERHFSEDAATRFIFGTGGKSAPNTQPPELTVTTTSPDGNAETLKSLAAFAEHVRKQAGVDAKDVKFDKDKEQTLDGEKAISFTGARTGKAGPAKFIYIVTLHNGTGYAVSFASDPATFDAEYAGAKPWIESIKWSK